MGKMFDGAVSSFLILFLLYLVVLVFLAREIASAGGIKKDGVQIKVFSVDPADGMRLLSFIMGKRTGVRRIDALRIVATVLIVACLSIFVSLQLVMNVPAIQRALFFHEKHHKVRNAP